MNSNLATVPTGKTSRLMLVTPDEDEMILKLRDLFNMEDDEARRSGWDSLGERGGIILFIGMLMDRLEMDVLEKLVRDLLDCDENGIIDPLIIVTRQGGAA